MTRIKLIVIILLTVMLIQLVIFTKNVSSNKILLKPSEKKTRITIMTAGSRDFDIIEKSIGQLESVQAPNVSTEISGRLDEIKVGVGDYVKKGQLLAIINDEDLHLSSIIAKAEANRLAALIRGQVRVVERHRNMVGDNYSSQSLLDQAVVQLEVLGEQLVGAKAISLRADYNLGKHRIVSPVDGQIEKRFVSIGNYLRNGDPLFKITVIDQLQVLLSFSETLAFKIKPGLAVRMTTPTSPNIVAIGSVSGIRPMVNPKNRAIYVIVNVQNPGNWKPGASVTAELILGEHKNVTMISQTAVITRPMGKVVYVIENEKAIQRPVTTGLVVAGDIEILSGLAVNEIVALDGAGFLTDQAPVSVLEYKE